MTKNTYRTEDKKKYYILECPRCGWEGLSRDCAVVEDSDDIETEEGFYYICPDCEREKLEIMLNKVE